MLKNAWMLICMTWSVFYLLLNPLQTRAHHHSKYHRDLLTDLSRHAAIWAGCFVSFSSLVSRTTGMLNSVIAARVFRKGCLPSQKQTHVYWKRPWIVYESLCHWKGFKAVTNAEKLSEKVEEFKRRRKKEEVMLLCFGEKVVAGSPLFPHRVPEHLIKHTALFNGPWRGASFSLWERFIMLGSH